MGNLSRASRKPDKDPTRAERLFQLGQVVSSFLDTTCRNRWMCQIKLNTNRLPSSIVGLGENWLRFPRSRPYMGIPYTVLTWGFVRQCGKIGIS